MIKSGKHLAIIRNWIISYCLNGDLVKWGSDTPLQIRHATPRVLETLATEIAEATKRELAKKVFKCSEFKPFGKRYGSDEEYVNVCKNCGSHEYWHKESDYDI